MQEPAAEITTKVPTSGSVDVLEKPRRNRTGMVYFVLAEEVWRIKIGWAGDPVARLVNLQVASPVDVALLGMIETSDPHCAEQKLQRDFAHLRVRGEWFKAAPALIAFIRKRRADRDIFYAVAEDMLAARAQATS